MSGWRAPELQRGVGFPRLTEAAHRGELDRRRQRGEVTQQAAGFGCAHLREVTDQRDLRAVHTGDPDHLIEHQGGHHRRLVDDHDPAARHVHGTDSPPGDRVRRQAGLVGHDTGRGGRQRQHDHVATSGLVGGGDGAQHRRLPGPSRSDDRRHPAPTTGDLIDRRDLIITERRVPDRVDGERGPVLGGGRQDSFLSRLDRRRRVLGGTPVGVLGVVVDLERHTHGDDPLGLDLDRLRCRIGDQSGHFTGDMGSGPPRPLLVQLGEHPLRQLRRPCRQPAAVADLDATGGDVVERGELGVGHTGPPLFVEVDVAAGLAVAAAGGGFVHHPGLLGMRRGAPVDRPPLGL